MKRFACAALALAALTAAPAVAQDKVKAVPVLIGLLNPSGLVAEEGTTHLLVSDSGAGRVLCFHTDGGEYEKVITKFAKDVYGKGPMYDIGPLGLAFAGKGNLIVGGGDRVDGKEVVYVFKMPPHGKSVEASTAKTLGPVIDPKDSPKGEGNYFGIVADDKAIYVTSNGDDTKGWILKAEGKNGEYGPLKPFIATKPLVNVDAPAAITLDEHGHLVVGQMGEVNVAGDSLLTVYDAQSGKLITSAKTGLSDLVGLAYSKGKLYGIDFSWADPKNGGLYRIELSGEDKKEATVKTEKLCSLDKPAAMAFGTDGKLYIAEFGTEGTAKDADGKPLLGPDGKPIRPGRVVVIEGDL
jgi:hypothetical protein